MTLPLLISGLSDLAGRYDVILSDVWGVIHNGEQRHPAACSALASWADTQGPVILISNAARPSADVVPQLRTLGIAQEVWQGFVSSGDATRAILAPLAPGPAWIIGDDRHTGLYEGLGMAFSDPDRAAFISCTGPNDDETDIPEDYRSRFEVAVARGLTMICANPDLVVQRGDRLIYCAGSLAKLYAELGGEVEMAGKPHAPIYASCLSEANRLLGRPVDRARVLCVGDGIPTDIIGANRQGLDVLFITSGIHAKEAVGQDAAGLAALLAQSGATTTYAITDLAW